jgi:hypothetical protein
LRQLERIFNGPGQPDSVVDYMFLKARVTAATNYFEPVLNNFSKKIASQITALQSRKKGVKQYINELQDLDLLFYGQLQRIYKACDLVDAAIDARELTKADMKQPKRQDAVAPVDGGSKKDRIKQQTDTREVTLEMFNSGKAAHEIAADRSLKISTIHDHLAHWIEEGEVNVHQLVPKTALDEIVDAFKDAKTRSLSPVKKALNHKYDYSELKLGLAFLKQQQWMGEE